MTLTNDMRMTKDNPQFVYEQIVDMFKRTPQLQEESIINRGFQNIASSPVMDDIEISKDDFKRQYGDGEFFVSFDAVIKNFNLWALTFYGAFLFDDRNEAEDFAVKLRNGGREVYIIPYTGENNPTPEAINDILLVKWYHPEHDWYSTQYANEDMVKK